MNREKNLYLYILSVICIDLFQASCKAVQVVSSGTYVLVLNSLQFEVSSTNSNWRSVIKRCPWYRNGNCVNFGLLGPWELSSSERWCPHYRGRNCINLGILGLCELSVIVIILYYSTTSLSQVSISGRLTLFFPRTYWINFESPAETTDI